MKKIILVFLLFVSAVFSDIYAQKQIIFDGVTIPRTIKFENKTLQLNGAGSRSKMWVEVYIQALYLTELSQDPKEIINSDTEMSIRIEVTSAIVSSGRLRRAIQNGFESSAPEKIAELKPKMLEFNNMMLEEITKGDVFELTYNPAEKSVWVLKNNVLKGKVAGFEFKKALFGIWLSDKPVDQDLKNSLLGI
jgi:hypothetical protein